MPGYHWGGAAHVLIWILVLFAVVGLITAMVVFIARALGARPVLPPTGTPTPAAPAPAVGPSQPSAREILDRRLASGEVTLEQYDEVRSKLDG
jgi:uncharacterized membrane protein